MDRRFLLMADTANLPDHWSKHEKAAELAQRAIEVGAADLPDIYSVTPGEFDRAVDDAYEFFYGEAVHYLEGHR